MRAIGLSFQKGRMRVTVLDHASGAVTHHASRAIAVDPDLELPDLMERYAAQIKAVITEFTPDIIAVRQVWSSKNMTAAMCQVAPQGIAAYVCRERAVKFSAYTPQAIRQPKPFGLAKGVTPLDAIDEIFGKHPPNWDDMQKYALLVAWRALLDQQ